jgi:DNA modification methylase
VDRGASQTAPTLERLTGLLWRSFGLESEKMTSPLSSWPADRVERWPVAKLVPNARNARTHSDEQVMQLAASIEEWGWTIPVLVDEAGGIIAGHGRIMAAQKLGIDDVPVMVAAGWSDAKKRAYMLADNKLTLNSEWDLGGLAIEIVELRASDFDVSLIGFSESEIDDLLKADRGGLTDPDEALELPADPVSELGDVWLLGRHRLVCGDCTDPLVVGNAMNGVKPHLMVTDPPYGIEYDAAWRGRHRTANGKRLSSGVHAKGKVENDVNADWREAWMLFPGDVAYVWHAAMRVGESKESLEEAGFALRAQIIWAKNNFAISRGHYHFQHEPCWYAVREGSTGHWCGGHKQTSVWQIDKPQKSETGHSAQKPVECMKRPIENNSSPGQAVYDPFVGSGTTIIAAEMTGRCCHAIELHPPYVDVSVLRWRNFTGLEARLEATGETFAEVSTGRLAHSAGSVTSGTKTARASKAKAGASPAA